MEARDSVDDQQQLGLPAPCRKRGEGKRVQAEPRSLEIGLKPLRTCSLLAVPGGGESSVLPVRTSAWCSPLLRVIGFPSPGDGRATRLCWSNKP